MLGSPEYGMTSCADPERCAWTTFNDLLLRHEVYRHRSREEPDVQSRKCYGNQASASQTNRFDETNAKSKRRRPTLYAGGGVQSDDRSAQRCCDSKLKSRASWGAASA